MGAGSCVGGAVGWPLLQASSVVLWEQLGNLPCNRPPLLCCCWRWHRHRRWQQSTHW